MLILLIVLLFVNMLLIIFCVFQIMYNKKQLELNDYLFNKIKEYESFKEQDKRDKMIIRECLRGGGLL